MATTAREFANRHAGVIEAAIRKSVAPGMILRTVPARTQFEVQKLSEGALVLLFGKKKTRTGPEIWFDRFCAHPGVSLAAMPRRCWSHPPPSRVCRLAIRRIASSSQRPERMN